MVGLGLRVRVSGGRTKGGVESAEPWTHIGLMGYYAQEAFRTVCRDTGNQLGSFGSRPTFDEHFGNQVTKL